jgi:hypothetical protein
MAVWTDGTGVTMIRDLVEGGIRYRVAKTPMGYLITLQGLFGVGSAMAPAEWLHVTEQAALACLDVAILGTVAANGGSLTAFERAVAAHNALCDDDPALVGQDVKELRERLFPA